MREYKKEHLNSRRIRYGWRISAHGYHVVDSVARSTIISILIMRSNGYTFEKIKNCLISKQLPSPRNGAWHCTTIKNIVENNSNCLVSNR